MATAKQAKTGTLTIIFRIAMIGAILFGLISFFFGEAIAGFGQAGTAFAAKSACSCRHIGDRDLDSCADDLPDNMWAIWLSEDDEAQSVTASVPLITSSTATYRDGPGCVLDSWES